MDEREKVRQFHEVTGQPVRLRPEMPDEATRVLRCRLLLEETLEFIKACGCTAWLGGTYRLAMVNVEIDSTHAPDLAAMAQENTDVRYVSYGNDLVMGVDGRVFAEVARANLDKAPGGVCTKRPDGKLAKPEGWKPPDVARVLEKWEP